MFVDGGKSSVIIILLEENNNLSSLSGTSVNGKMDYNTLNYKHKYFLKIILYKIIIHKIIFHKKYQTVNISCIFFITNTKLANTNTKNKLFFINKKIFNKKIIKNIKKWIITP